MFRRLVTFLGLVSLFALSSAQTATIYVPDDHGTIKDAVDAAVNGDVIVLRPGTYTGSWNTGVYFKGKAITITSEKGPAETIVDCQDVFMGFVFGHKETSASRLDSITIANGYGSVGGGIYCGGSSPTISNCVIRDCGSVASGGAIRCVHNCNPTITGCTIRGNMSSGACGGIYLEWHSSATITDCVIEENLGSAVSCVDSATVVIEGCTFRRNQGRSVVISDAATTIGNSVFVNNQATPVSTTRTGAIITGCAFLHNLGWGSSGGINCYDDTPAITNCTFAYNDAGGGFGGAIYFNNSDGIVTNTIFWGDSARQGDEIYLDGWANPSTLHLSHSDLGGGLASVQMELGSQITWGAGLIDADPLFAEPNMLDTHLTYHSPCRDAGDPLAPNLPATDLEGDPMASSGAVDMGADQYHIHLYHLGGVVPGSKTDLRFVGEPGDPVYLLLGSGIVDPPVPTVYGDLYLLAPIRAFGGPNIPATGVLITSATVPAAWLPGETFPFQALVGGRLTNLMALTAE